MYNLTWTVFLKYLSWWQKTGLIRFPKAYLGFQNAQARKHLENMQCILPILHADKLDPWEIRVTNPQITQCIVTIISFHYSQSSPLSTTSCYSFLGLWTIKRTFLKKQCKDGRCKRKIHYLFKNAGNVITIVLILAHLLKYLHFQSKEYKIPKLPGI